MTIHQWVNYFISKYTTIEEFKIDLDKNIKELEDDKASPNQVAFLKRVRNKVKKIDTRLEELRAEINAERISTAELIELQTLSKFIDSGDIQLLEWAGVEEFDEDKKPYQRFIEFLHSDNIIKQNGGYLTQCSQYGKLFTRKELYAYFKKNYI
jgi:hypothetical protein